MANPLAHNVVLPRFLFIDEPAGGGPTTISQDIDVTLESDEITVTLEDSGEIVVLLDEGVTVCIED